MVAERLESDDERRRVTEAYAANPALVAALDRIAKLREPLIGKPLDLLTTYRPDLSGTTSWSLAGARFFVVTVTSRDSKQDGPVFEAPDGTRYVMRPARTDDEARSLAAVAGPEASIFAARPYWGMPAPEWIAADPVFWKLNPAATVKSR